MPQSGLDAGAPYSFRDYTGDGSNRIFSITFPYLSRDHIAVYVGGVLTTAFTYLTDSSIQLTVAPANGVAVYLRRDTPPVSPMVTFNNGAALKGGDLNTNGRQLLYVVQEAVDSALTILAMADAVEAAKLAAAASAAAAATSAADAAAVLAQVLAAALALTQTYDISVSIPILPGSGSNAAVYVMSRSLSLAAGASGRIKLAVVGSVNTVLSIKKNAVEIGTATVIAGSTSGTVSITSTTAWAANDVLTIESATSDPAAAPSGVSLTLNFTRT